MYLARLLLLIRFLGVALAGITLNRDTNSISAFEERGDDFGDHGHGGGHEDHGHDEDHGHQDHGHEDHGHEDHGHEDHGHEEPHYENPGFCDFDNQCQRALIQKKYHPGHDPLADCSSYFQVTVTLEPITETVTSTGTMTPTMETMTMTMTMMETTTQAMRFRRGVKQVSVVGATGTVFGPSHHWNGYEHNYEQHKQYEQQFQQFEQQHQLKHKHESEHKFDH
ncbi:hypothetical protein NKR19_g4844 [Coniochaeta hoffmannii]|uniref:Uncharacterized protein n=1 Tax=Coniochaeta hoffmannii TaxID=91930 RepID=A0AA38S0P3_9PEZI|nr:hypothetical protein NKR19_g4844 [Coniochaeta hoffmannii]